jgi:type IV pilus assembly protein PilN
MIKINLLQRKKEGKAAKGRKEMMITVAAVGLLVALLAFLHWQMMAQKDEVARKITSTEQEIALYKSKIDKASKAKEEQKILKDKLQIINSLQKQKSSSAKVLDEVSVQKPEKIHLEVLKKDGSKVGIEGIALDDETVANFMTNLRKTNLFKSVDLIVSEQVEQSKIKLKKFTLSCEILPM